jgi:hypothetical protein
MIRHQRFGHHGSAAPAGEAIAGCGEVGAETDIVLSSARPVAAARLFTRRAVDHA